MASLLAPLPDDARSFLRVAGDGFVAAGGCWPCWQWVRQQLWTRHGLDAEQILGGLPTWEYDYRPVRLGYRGQPVPKIADEVPLSIHGMAYVYPAVPAVRQLVDAFLTALKTAAVMQHNISPEPTRPAELKVPGDDFTRTVNMAAGTELSAAQLFAVLGGEPATWLGINQHNGNSTWDLTAEGEDLPRGPGTPFVVCAAAAESERSGAGAPPVLRRWRHHLPGKSAGGRDHDQRPVRGTDREGSRVIFLENAQDVGDLFAVTRAGPAPADHDPLADIGGCEADLEPVAHAGHLFPGWAARRRVPGPGPGAWIVAGLGAAAGSDGRLRVGDGGMMPF